MPMTHVNELLAVRIVELELDPGLTMKVGVGAVDPRLIEPDHQEPDTEELIAFWTSCL